jgi:nucleoside-diphosphate-sugar epimerase
MKGMVGAVHTVAVTGMQGALGRRIASASAAGDLNVRPGDAASGLAGATAVIDASWSPLRDRGRDREHPTNIKRVSYLLDAAATYAVPTLVHLSSATVYGAWPDNPVPLSEDAPLRPNPGFLDAVERAEAERVVLEWAADHPEVAVCILRPGVVVGAGRRAWLTAALTGAPPLHLPGGEPPRQFVHIDDVAAAAVLAARERLDGTFNVVPDGWIAGEAMRALAPWRPSVGMPRSLSMSLHRAAWRVGGTEVPPTLVPMIEHPWVVANDRLRAAGWLPSYSNEEALVSGRPPSAWRDMNPQRRQTVALGASAAAIAGAAAAAGALAVRASRGRARSAV